MVNNKLQAQLNNVAASFKIATSEVASCEVDLTIGQFSLTL